MDWSLAKPPKRPEAVPGTFKEGWEVDPIWTEPPKWDELGRASGDLREPQRGELRAIRRKLRGPSVVTA